MMRPLGVKAPVRRVFGGKMVNRGLKFGAKSLGYVGDLIPAAAVLAPEALPVLETAKAMGIGLGVLQKGRQMIKHGR